MSLKLAYGRINLAFLIIIIIIIIIKIIIIMYRWGCISLISPWICHWVAAVLSASGACGGRVKQQLKVNC